MSRARYRIELCLDAACRPVIALVDLGIGCSITNDAENVIADFVRAGIDVDSYRFVYRDTQGIWDGLLVTDGVFVGFEAIGVRTLEEALR